MKETYINIKNKDILVSVIVLTYNHRAYIQRALDSVLMQKTKFPIEILIGDDASKDGTTDIIREYEGRYPNLIHPFFRMENIGGTKNLCDLLRKARGEYIIGCEGDDYWTDPYKLEKQIEYMNAHPECMGCTHPVTVVDENEIPLTNQRLRWICNQKVYTLKDFKGVFLPGHPVTLLHKNIFCDNESVCSFIEKAHLHIADRTIAMLLAAQGEIHRLDGNMACYRKVLRKDGKNVTSLIFVAKADSKLMEYRMTNLLEEYAKKNLGVNADFNWFRRDLLLRAIVKAILKPSEANWACLLGIWEERRKYRRNYK